MHTCPHAWCRRKCDEIDFLLLQYAKTGKLSSSKTQRQTISTFVYESVNIYRYPFMLHKSYRLSTTDFLFFLLTFHLSRLHSIDVIFLVGIYIHNIAVAVCIVRCILSNIYIGRKQNTEISIEKLNIPNVTWLCCVTHPNIIRETTYRGIQWILLQLKMKMMGRDDMVMYVRISCTRCG